MADEARQIRQSTRIILEIRTYSIIAAREYYYQYINYEEVREVSGGRSYITRIRDISTIPRIRRPNYGGFTVMIAQYMCLPNRELSPTVHPDRQSSLSVAVLNQLLECGSHH